jgi:hypothetical protein
MSKETDAIHGAVAAPVEQLVRPLVAAYSTITFAFCDATAAMRQFSNIVRLYVDQRGRRRMPAQLRRRGPRGRARVLKARRDSLGFRCWPNAELSR